MSQHPVAQVYGRHVNPAFVKLLGVLGYGRVFVRAEDIWIWDDQGRRYLDLLAGFGSVNIGHNHPRLRRRLHEFLDSQPLNLVHVGPSESAARIAEALTRLAGDPFEIAMFSSSGAEAVEAGLKVSRAATGRKAFLACKEGFHGTNLGTLSVLGGERMKNPFRPLIPDCEFVPFGDLPALEMALAGKRFAAFVVEPVPAEGGVLLPPDGYLADVSRLCRKAGTLLVLDEVQTGLGRTGKMFAFQAEGFVPDVLVLAKSLGGSLAPIGATLTTARIHSAAYGAMNRFDLHGSTFGGNSLSCVAALESLAILEDERLSEKSAERGQEFLHALRKRLDGHPFVTEVRGRGLLIGIELGPTDSTWLGRTAPAMMEGLAELILGQWVAVKLLERGFLCQPASQKWNVLKLEPPLTIPADEVLRAVAAIGEVLDECTEMSPFLSDVAKRLGEQVLCGGAFR